jgi:hypothetical protein
MHLLRRKGICVHLIPSIHSLSSSPCSGEVVPFFIQLTRNLITGWLLSAEKSQRRGSPPPRSPLTTFPATPHLCSYFPIQSSGTWPSGVLLGIGNGRKGRQSSLSFSCIVRTSFRIPSPAYPYVFLYTFSPASLANLEISAASAGLACGTTGTVSMARVELQLGRRPNSYLCIFSARLQSLSWNSACVLSCTCVAAARLRVVILVLKGGKGMGKMGRMGRMGRSRRCGRLWSRGRCQE